LHLTNIISHRGLEWSFDINTVQITAGFVPPAPGAGAVADLRFAGKSPGSSDDRSPAERQL
jgi:hypothetical protein